MPIVEIEREPGKWERLEVTYAERRQILLASQPEQRFVQGDVVYIAHPLNLWCDVSNDTIQTTNTEVTEG